MSDKKGLFTLAELKNLTKILIAPALKTAGFWWLILLTTRLDEPYIGYAGGVMLAAWYLQNWAKGD